ncbi:uncharacterized protein LOC143022188 [Oratosquilla oratoria]|uniref:uncharacterized protein LOC143022188 n=1 Tax=Oratosquilla oratoria TaxID=337810 RepID=UPI003F76D4E5
MCPGLTNDLQQVDDSRKTAIINRELERLNIDIAALQETRLLSSGSLREQDYTFFWQGNETEELHMHGVGFSVRNSLLPSVEPPSKVNVLSIYAPILSSPAETKDEFYEELETTIREIPATEQLYLLGDFNVRVGADQESWPHSIGPFGVGKLNENGQRLLEMCSYHDLCVTNTFFATKPQHRVSWCHPRSRHWHQLDLIVTRRPSLNCVLTTRSYHSADCDTDHSLVNCKVRFQPKRIHRSKQRGHPRINIARTKMPDLCKRFADSTEEALRDCPTNSAEERWNHIHGAIYNSAMDTLGRRERQNPDWKARNDAQRLARRSANDYWLNLCQSIQLAADCGNIRAMYDSLKKAFGPSITKIATLKTASVDTITDRGKQMERWAEHYQELYSRENVVTTASVETNSEKPSTPWPAGKLLATTASPRRSSKRARVPFYITTCTSFYSKRVYPEAQCGFRAERSTIDMIFSLRQLQEKCREQRRPLYIAFIDLTKAFDLVSRQGLFTLLQRIGCPPKLLRMISSFHEDMHGTVQYDGSSSDPFSIRSGVKQGCVLAPTLFGIFFSLLLSYAFIQSEDGVYIHTRNDGSLFKLAHLRAKTKVRKVLIREMLWPLPPDGSMSPRSVTAAEKVQVDLRWGYWVLKRTTLSV